MKNPGVYRGSKDIEIASIWPNCFYMAIFELSWLKKHFSEWIWYCNKLIVLIIWQLSFLSLWCYHDMCFVSSFFPYIYVVWLFGFMVFNATFNSISWRSVLLVKKTAETRKKPPTCHKSLTNFITYCCTPRPEWDSNAQHQWW